MIVSLRKPIALLLVILTVFSMIPFGYAAEITTDPTATTESGVDPPLTGSEQDDATLVPSSEQTASELAPDEQATAAADDVGEDETAGSDELPIAAPEAATENTDDTADEEALEEPFDWDEDDPFAGMTEEEIIALYAMYGVDLLSTTTSNITLFDQASPNYTVVLSSQIAVTYKPNGTGSAVTAYLKNIGWHYAGSNPDHTMYCMEPHKEFGASTSLNAVDNGVTVSGSGGSTHGEEIWYALPAARRTAIGLILLYSDQRWASGYPVKTTPKANNPNVPLRTATQFLIYEIVTGLRDPNTFVRNSSNGYTSGDVYYNAGVANVSGFADHYNAIVSAIQAQMAIPSFTASSSGSAPTLTMTGDTLTVTDSNGVLSNFSFTNGNGASFSKSGNRLTITKTGTISESTVFSCSRNLPSAANSTYHLWYSPYISSRQTLISLDTGSTGSVKGYFKIKANTSGNLSLTKTTEDGKNLSGWQFSIYSNSACTALVSGPHTTDSSGKISVTGLNAGTYYVKEIGHNNSATNALYTCASTNPQKVTITAGSTASVSFTNNLVPGNLSLTKTTEDGKNLQGWQFSIYSNSACTTLVSGPHTTNSSGKISVTGIKAGTYYVKEVGHSDSAIAAQYTCGSTNPQKVTISAGATATVSFTNNLVPGNVSITKKTDDGQNLNGWQFNIYSNSGCTTLVSGPHTSNNSGKISVTGLKAGTYWIKEIGHTDSAINALYTCASTNPQQVTVTAGATASVTFTNNRLRGSIQITKTTNTNGTLGGWKVGIYTDAGCTKPISGSPFTTGSDGKITVSDLVPGTYYAKEIDESAQNPYWEYDHSVKSVTVTANQTASVSFRNTQYGDFRIKKNAINGSPEGWKFFILSGDQTDIMYTLITDASGYAYSPKLLPGTYTVREAMVHDDTYWEYDVNIERQVTVTAGKQTTIEYTNTQYGMMEFHKTTNTGHHLEGWTFVVFKDAEKIGEYTTDANGYACTGKLEPGRYTVFEKQIEDEYWTGILTSHTVTVTAGETAADYWNNCENGKAIFRKTTNTGENLSGWIITIYSDATCTEQVRTATTDEEGVAKIMLEPGIYYAKETGHTQGLSDDDYWQMDDTPRKVEIKAHEDTEVSWENTHTGKILIVKTMETEGTPEGWQFAITDSEGHAIEGSPFTTDTNGHILTGNLLPGEYTVEEVLPQDSPYTCKGENPQRVTVTQGKTAEVSFVNTLKPGSIKINKIDITGTPLEGAEFCLHWSEDGSKWYRVQFSEELKKGYCSSAALNNGCMTTGTDGVLEWTNLYPGLYYRLSEVKAPDGYNLLDDVAFEGQLAKENLEVSLNVINTRVYTLPKTGSSGLRIVQVLAALSMVASISFIAIPVIRRKRG